MHGVDLGQVTSQRFSGLHLNAADHSQPRRRFLQRGVLHRLPGCLQSSRTDSRSEAQSIWPDLVCKTFVREGGGNKNKVRDSDGRIWTYGDLLFQVVRLLSQLFHFTHGAVCQARSLQ